MSLLRKFDQIFSHDASGGIALMISAFAALVVANSPLSEAYHSILNLPFSVTLDGEGLSKPLILWINDGLMAVFFLLVGLELKREMLEGKLREPRNVMLPGLAAVGGMAVPALVYQAFNWTNPVTRGGWAIPAATDIAFALGVLALVGKGVPASLKIFLLTLAILDDLGAIVIIALFYTADLKMHYLLLALVPLALMGWRNALGLHRNAPTLILGAVLWVLVLKSGVHATLAGVATAFFIPLKDRFGRSPLHALEDGLSPYVLFLIVPVFAFANAGVVLSGMTFADMFAALPVGIALGLVAGKFVGVLGTSWLLVRSGAADMPSDANWSQMAGIAFLAGIGFTMSLFIGSLSFADALHMNEVRLGVLSGSAVSAVLGFAILRAGARQSSTRPAAATSGR